MMFIINCLLFISLKFNHCLTKHLIIVMMTLLYDLFEPISVTLSLHYRMLIFVSPKVPLRRHFVDQSIYYDANEETDSEEV
jgi:hypothetical protein